MAQRRPFSAGGVAAFDDFLARWLPGPCRLRSLAGSHSIPLPSLRPFPNVLLIVLLIVLPIFPASRWPPQSSAQLGAFHHEVMFQDPFSHYETMDARPHLCDDTRTGSWAHLPSLSILSIPRLFSFSSLIPPCSYLSPPAPRFPTNNRVPHPDPSTLWLLENTAKQYCTMSNMPQNITSKWKTTLMFWNWLNESTAGAARTCWVLSRNSGTS